MTRAKKKTAEELTVVPRHVAVIMDGNGRWATERKLPRYRGHLEGIEAIRRLVRAADDIGIRYLTLYSFSTENWRRPKKEVAFLFVLMDKQLRGRKRSRCTGKT